uniref:Uncharacterized protein n=1 Tax=Anguilla anguilla TaxID=7936 RepID=A0A0E9V242_ANGAN
MFTECFIWLVLKSNSKPIQKNKLYKIFHLVNGINVTFMH